MDENEEFIMGHKDFEITLEDDETEDVEEAYLEGNKEVSELDGGIAKYRYVLVELSQLEKLLQRCPDCGRLPGGRSTGQRRHIKWLKNGIFVF